MKRAIALTANCPRLPFGALIVCADTGEVVAEGWNKSAVNPTWHEEIPRNALPPDSHPEPASQRPEMPAAIRLTAVDKRFDSGFEALREAPVALIAKDGQFTWWQWLKARHGFEDERLRPYNFNLGPFLANPRGDGREPH